MMNTEYQCTVITGNTETQEIQKHRVRHFNLVERIRGKLFCSSITSLELPNFEMNSSMFFSMNGHQSEERKLFIAA